MAADSATEVESLFEKLHQHISQGSDSRVLKVAEQSEWVCSCQAGRGRWLVVVAVAAVPA
jgi:hypothetical protein